MLISDVIILLRYPLSQPDGCQLSQRESQERRRNSRQISIWRAGPADKGAPGEYVIRDSWAVPGNVSAQ